MYSGSREFPSYRDRKAEVWIFATGDLRSLPVTCGLRLLPSPSESPAETASHPLPAFLGLVHSSSGRMAHSDVARGWRGWRRHGTTPAGGAGAGILNHRHAISAGIAGPAAGRVVTRRLTAVMPAQCCRERRGGAWNAGRSDGWARVGHVVDGARRRVVVAGAEHPVVQRTTHVEALVRRIASPASRDGGTVVLAVSEERDEHAFLHQFVDELDCRLECFRRWGCSVVGNGEDLVADAARQVNLARRIGNDVGFQKLLPQLPDGRTVLWARCGLTVFGTGDRVVVLSVSARVRGEFERLEAVVLR